MELIERINALEGDQKLVKSEIKKVLVDLREMMNTAENPFSYLEQLKEGTAAGVDKKRLKKLEDAMEQLKELGGGNGIEIEEERIKKLEDAMEQLKEMGGGNGIGMDEEMIKNLEDSMEELKELGSVEVERLKNLEDAMEKLAETGTEIRSHSEKPLIHNPMAASELSEIGVGAGIGVGIGIGAEVETGNGNGIVNTVTLAQLMQWADTALNLIGMAKLNQIVELYELTGRISREMKDTILKIAELPDAVLRPKKEQVETKHCVIALCELDRILTGEHQELFTLLKELCNGHNHNPLPLNSNLRNHDVKHSQVQTKSQSTNPKKNENEKEK
jgi:hypothetical protein